MTTVSMILETMFCIYISKHIHYDGFETWGSLMVIGITVLSTCTMNYIILYFNEDPTDYSQFWNPEIGSEKCKSYFLSIYKEQVE